MAEVRPFRGLLYSGYSLEDISDVLAPPYDVISHQMREELYSTSDYNVVRLILGSELKDDNENQNKYLRARRFLDEWISKGILVTDVEDSFYVYRQDYELQGVEHSRIGFLGLMKIEGPDMVLPHEHTLLNPKQDRMSLIKKVECNLSPIFGLYHGDAGRVIGMLKEEVSSVEPIICADVDGVRNRLWKIADRSLLESISGAIADKKVFIADGHHRYAVAKAYRDLCREQDGYDGRADYVLTYLTDMSADENLTVLATHRLIKDMPEIQLDEFYDRLKKYFKLTFFDSVGDLLEEMDKRKKKSYIFGFFDGKVFCLMEPKEDDILKGLIADKPTCWKDLDVSVLHSVILEKLMGIVSRENELAYIKDPEEACSLVRTGKGRAVFFLNPTKLEQLRAVAESGEMMPQKSTYFYPKLMTGLVMNRFEDQKEIVRKI